MAVAGRSRLRSLSRVDYSIIADVKVPRRARVSKKVKQSSKQASKLYRLKILEEDRVNGLVKVGYVGYGSEYDEWRPQSDIVFLSGEGDDDPDPGSGDESAAQPSLKPFSLYDELAYRIKSLLVSHRKGDPLCCISMTFDTIFFDGLILRGTAVGAPRKVKIKKYTLSSLTKLEDILGHRWYIRGLNVAGDFCYVKPGTVSYYLKYTKGGVEYQLKQDGTLDATHFGQRHQLIFKFVREDGTASQWNDVLKLCQ